MSALPKDLRQCRLVLHRVVHKKANTCSPLRVEAHPKVHDGSGTSPQYSLPFGRGGDAAVFSFIVTQIEGGVTLVMAVEHQDAEKTWLCAGSVSASTPGVSRLRVSGLKKELRFKFTSSMGSSGDLVRLLIPPPRWFPS